jgi:putative flippase GtrA
MKTMIQSLLRRTGYRYFIIGGSVYLLELVIIVVSQMLGASPVLAVSLSFWIGLLTSFILQKTVTFSDKRTHHRVLLSQTFAFALLVAFNYCFTVLLTKLLADQLPLVAVRTLALLITTIWNFYLYKTHIFKNSPGLLG